MKQATAALCLMMLLAPLAASDLPTGPGVLDCPFDKASDQTLVLFLSGTMGIEVRYDLDVTVTYHMCTSDPYCEIEENDGHGFFVVLAGHPNNIWKVTPTFGWYEGLNMHGEGQCFLYDGDVHARMSGSAYDSDLNGGGMFRASTLLGAVVDVN